MLKDFLYYILQYSVLHGVLLLQGKLNFMQLKPETRGKATTPVWLPDHNFH